MDIATIFSVSNGLKEYNATNISPLALYASRVIFGRSLLNESIQPKGNHLKILNSLEIHFKYFVREACVLKENSGERIVNVYTSFFRNLDQEGRIGPPATSSLEFKYDYTIGPSLLPL